jgi:hypothetical protein
MRRYIGDEGARGAQKLVQGAAGPTAGNGKGK